MALLLIRKTCNHFSDLRKFNLKFTLSRIGLRQMSLSKKAPISNKKNIIFTRSYFQKIFAKPTIEQIKSADGIPEYYNIIYSNGMKKYILLAQITSVGSALMLAIWVAVTAVLENKPSSTQWGNPDQPKPKESEMWIFFAVFAALCVSLQVFIARTPQRIYNKKDKYIFVFYGTFPTTTRQLTCRLHEIVKSEEYGIIPWSDSTYEIVNKQKLIMLESFFRRPADLNIILGYQKPED